MWGCNRGGEDVEERKVGLRGRKKTKRTGCFSAFGLTDLGILL